MLAASLPLRRKSRRTAKPWTRNRLYRLHSVHTGASIGDSLSHLCPTDRLSLRCDPLLPLNGLSAQTSLLFLIYVLLSHQSSPPNGPTHAVTRLIEAP